MQITATPLTRTFPNHDYFPEYDLWNGKFSVRFHGKSFSRSSAGARGSPSPRVKTRSLLEKYPYLYICICRPRCPSVIERIVSQFKPAQIIVASALVAQWLAMNEISSIREYRRLLIRASLRRISSPASQRNEFNCSRDSRVPLAG